MTAVAAIPPAFAARSHRRPIRWPLRALSRRGGPRVQPSPDRRWCGPVVTFTATAGTPVVALSTAVADGLGLPLYDAVFPALVAATTGASLADACDMDGVVPSRVAVALAWSAFHPGAPELDGTLAAVRVLERFPAATRDVIDAIAADPAGGVIVNRHARFALAGHDRAVHVLLDAPLRWRQEALQAEHGWSATAAHDHLRAADRAQRRYAARAHDVDPTEPSHYDVVVDPSSLGVHGAVAEVLAAATRLGLTPAYDRPR